MWQIASLGKFEPDPKITVEALHHVVPRRKSVNFLVAEPNDHRASARMSVTQAPKMASLAELSRRDALIVKFIESETQYK